MPIKEFIKEMKSLAKVEPDCKVWSMLQKPGGTAARAMMVLVFEFPSKEIL